MRRSAALLDLAFPQPFLDIGDRLGGRLRPEDDADESSRHQTTLARKERPLRAMRSESCPFGNWRSLLNSMVVPLIGDVADDAFARRAAFPDLGDAAIITLSRTLSRRSRIECLPTKRETCPRFVPRKYRLTQKAALT